MRAIRRFSVVGIVVGALLAPSIQAMDLATYDAQRKTASGSATQARLRVYLLGVGEGLRLSNLHLAERGAAPMFCLSQTTSLFAEDYFKLIDAALKESRGTFEREQRSVESILLEALRKAHECPDRAGRGSEARAAEPPPIEPREAAPAAVSAPAPAASPALPAIPPL